MEPLGMPINLPPPILPPVPAIERAVERPKKATHPLKRTVLGIALPPPKDPPKADKVVSEEILKEHSRKYDERHAKPLPEEMDKNIIKEHSPLSVSKKQDSIEKSTGSNTISRIRLTRPKSAKRIPFSNRKYSIVLPATKKEDYKDPPLNVKPYVEDGRKKKGILNDKEAVALYQTCEALGIPLENRDEFIKNTLINRAKLSRPKWKSRLSGEDKLRMLSAPNFLRYVHSDYISDDGTVHSDIIKAIDPDLMIAVDDYIRKRRDRHIDPGDAKGLNFVLDRPRTSSPFHQQPRRAEPT